MCKVKGEFFGGAFFESYTTSEAPSKPQRLLANLKGSPATSEAPIKSNLRGSEKNAGLDLTSVAHTK